ncbi:MAG: hypothetical protein LBT45_01470 [Rickettsiales bacterium]|jgi:hypothetical protein|nr:hypothetical protein [Rickettsiales bacterium]
MKKTLAFLLLGLAACTGLVEKNPETENITQLRDEPIGCQFLYRLEVDALVYNKEDAIAYLENRIVDQARKGNAYWIVSIRTNPKEWKFFGQERSYIITTNVYKCPANVITRSDLEKTSDYHLYDWGEE